MGTIETIQQSVPANELTRRQAVKQWMRARSDGVTGGVGGLGTAIFVSSQSSDNPVIDRLINSGTAGFLIGAAVSFIVFLATSRHTISEQGMARAIEKRNELAQEAKSLILRRRKPNT